MTATACTWICGAFGASVLAGICTDVIVRTAVATYPVLPTVGDKAASRSPSLLSR